MIRGLDSSYSHPTPATLAQARAAGYQMWSGYLATRPRVGLASPWTKDHFDLARQLGCTPIAYCSGWDDPVACKALAAAWNVRLCLDDEGTIRRDGSWVQDWLDASGAGLYGNQGVHAGRRAAFHVLSAYIRNEEPSATWSTFSPVPPSPKAWQWHGSAILFGCTVDLSVWDDWFGPNFILTPTTGGHGPMPVSSSLEDFDTTVCTVGAFSVAQINFASPFPSTPVVIVCNGDANEGGGAGDMVVNVVANSVTPNGFQVVCIKAPGGGVTPGALVRLNWIAKLRT